MIKWFKELFRVVREFKDLQDKVDELQIRLKNQRTLLNEAYDMIKDRTEVSVDVGVKGPSRIILSGRYKNNDFVEVFDIPDKDFIYVVDMLKDMRKSHVVRVIDGPFECKDAVLRLGDY